tara:strand:+ start:47 stop:472 length:426 start_codon:yes stop_codon:yes gene_type:complete
MNKVVGVIFAVAGAIIVLYKDKKNNIRIQDLENQNIRLVSLVERLKYENKSDKLKNNLKYEDNFDLILEPINNVIFKSDSFEELNQKIEVIDSESDSDSNSFQDFNQINELSESLNSELESLNSDDDSSKSKIDPSLSNLV